jgi:hypothetical protein
MTQFQTLMKTTLSDDSFPTKSVREESNHGPRRVARDTPAALKAEGAANANRSSGRLRRAAA